MKYSSLCSLLLSLSLFLPVNYSMAIEWPMPVYQALQKHKTAVAGLATLATAGLLSQQLLATDYGAVTIGHKDYYWDWEHIDTSAISFDKSFLFGAGTSAYQVEGNCNNTDWHAWEQQVDDHGNARVQRKSGSACDHWNRYKEDIELIDEIGAGIYRFSLSWDKIQPAEDRFDESAMEHYKDVCRALKAKNIKILIGFHHYTDPAWFADLGGFEKEENIVHFVAYCSRVFQSFHDAGVEVDLWTIFNSPSGYAFHKYQVGDFPPGIKNNKQLTLMVLKNMCESHVQVYQAAKKIDRSFKIGLLKNIIHLDPWRPWHPLDNLACDIAMKMTDECMFSFFATGVFKAKIPFETAPFMANIEHVNNLAPYSVDFVGLNYYSHSYIKNMQRINHPEEVQTNNPNYTIYPEGLYRAIVKVTECLCKPIEQQVGREIPLYVTENGVAHQDPATRKLFFERYMYAMYKAIEDGYNVKGYIYWSLMDNYEWGSYSKKYGLIDVDFNHPALKRTIKNDIGTEYFISLMKQYK